MKMNKRGNTEMLLTGVLALMLGGIILIFGLVMLDELYINTVDTTVTVNNETLTTMDEAGEYITSTSLDDCGFSGFTVLNMYNASIGTIELASPNWSIVGREGKVIGTGSVDVNGSDWNITYTYDMGNNSACVSANLTITGQGKYGDYIDLIALAIVISVVVSLVLILGVRRLR